MKTLLISSIALVLLTSCIKQSIYPIHSGGDHNHPPPVVDTTVIPDGSYYKIEVASSNPAAINNCVVEFSSAFHNAYVPGEDAPNFPGFGILQSWTMADTVALAVNCKVYQHNVPTPFVVVTKVTDTYQFYIVSKILPPNAHIWLVGKDSVDITTVPYTAVLSGTNTYKLYLK